MTRKLCLFTGLLLCGLAIALFVKKQPVDLDAEVVVDPVQEQLADLSTTRVSALGTDAFESELHDRTSDRFPDIELLDHRGRNLRFYSDLVQDRCVCIIYFYTRCTGSCPGTTRLVKKLRKELADQFSNDELVFVSLTLEPDVDTPEELREYMDANGIQDDENLPDWVYATGDYEEIDNLRRSLGIYDLDPIIDADKTEHAAILTFGNDRTDRWAALPVGMNFEQLKMAMTRIMGENPRQRYASVVRYREESLARYEASRGFPGEVNSGKRPCDCENPESCQVDSHLRLPNHPSTEPLDDTFSLRTNAAAG